MKTPLLEENEAVAMVEQHFAYGGVYAKLMRLEKAGWFVKQHRHAYDHMTLLTRGSMRVWLDDEVRDYQAPNAILVVANKHHTMMALEDDTEAYCIHRLNCGDAEIEILGD